MKQKSSFEKGQALIIIVLSLIGLLGITALAVDGGNAYVQKRTVQNAADTAALGGALARIRGEDWVSVAYKIAKSNGYNNDRVTNFVQIYSPPISGPNARNIDYIQVQIRVQSPTYFAKILGIDQIPVLGEAVTRTTRPVITQILQGNAVISLAPTSDCEDNKSFDVSGESTLAIQGGGIFVNSNNPDCALSLKADGSIRLKDSDATIAVVGGASVRKPQLVTPYPPQTGAAPISYPPPFLLPKPNCNKDAVVSDDGKSISAGDYGGGVFPPEGVTGLQPGIYCIGGDFIVNDGVLVGNGVVILLESGQLHFGARAEIQLTAPQNGQYKGLLLYAPLTNHHIIALNGNHNSVYAGTILAPGAEIRLKGNDSGFGFHSQIIGYRIMSDGNSNIIINYKDNQNYDALTMPEIQFTQ